MFVAEIDWSDPQLEKMLLSPEELVVAFPFSPDTDCSELQELNMLLMFAIAGVLTNETDSNDVQALNMLFPFVTRFVFEKDID